MKNALLKTNNESKNGVSKYLHNFANRDLERSTNPVYYIKDKNISPIIESYFKINYLKELYKQEWLDNGVPKEKCESIADHVYGVAMLTLFAGEEHFKELDINKALRIALFHELNQVYSSGNNSLESSDKLFAKFKNSNNYMNSLKEYEEDKTPESKFVRGIVGLESEVQAVAYEMDGHSRTDNSNMEFYLEINSLKELYRQGWLDRGIPKDKCEKVSGHIFGVTMLALLIAEEEFPELDINKVVIMSLLHEVGEIYGGDITPYDNISEEEKHQIELESVNRVLKKIPNGEKYISIWEEFEECKTPEARFVKQIDKLECGMQAIIYDMQGYPRMDEFFQYTLDRLKEEKLKNIMEQTMKLRKISA